MIYLALLAPVLALGLLIAMSKVETWHDAVNPERARARGETRMEFPRGRV